jgi:hypothetical protein
MSSTCGEKRIYMWHVLAEKSAGDGAAVMVDEFLMKMKGCCDGRVRAGESCEL